MPDLDELLTEDAGRFQAAQEPAIAFGPALDRALGVASRRRARTVGISAVAVAAVAAGVGFAVNVGSDEKQPPVRLAAYDRVLGPVPNDDGSVYVVGPKDEHTAACEVMPNMTATRLPTDGDPTRPDVAISFGRLPGMDGNPNFRIQPGELGEGPLYVFICPTS